MNLEAEKPPAIHAKVIGWLFAITAAQCLLSEFFYMLGRGPSILKSIQGILLYNVFFCHLLFGFAMYWYFHFGRKLSSKNQAGLAFLGLLGEGWLFFQRSEQGLLYRVLSLGAGLGMVGLGCLLWELRIRSVRTRHGSCFMALCLLPLSFLSGGWLINCMPRNSNFVYDLHLHAADLTLYRSLSAYTVAYMPELPKAIFQIVYEFLGLAMVWCEVAFLSQPARFRLNPVVLFYLEGALAMVFYSQLPAVGSAVAFSTFPHLVPTQFAIQTLAWPGFEPRTCFPSMHICWALSVFCLCLSYSRQGWAWLLFLCGTLISVFSFGNHYIVDVLAAFPMAAACHALCGALLVSDSRRRARVLGALALLGMLFFELILLRDYSAIWFRQRLALWSLFLSILATACVMEWWLHPGSTGSKASVAPPS